MDRPGDGLAVGADEVDFRVVLPVPPAADHLGLRPVPVGQQPGERFTHDRLDGPAAPGRPRAFDPGQEQIGATAFDQGDAACQESQPES
jgi:hypothetical protein